MSDDATLPTTWKVMGDAIWVNDNSACIMWAYATAKCGRAGDEFYGCMPPRPAVTVRWRSPSDLALALAAPDLLEAHDPDTLDAIASEIECFVHSARAASLRYLAKRARAAIALARAEASPGTSKGETK